jgi:hypothetical protein
MKDPLGREGYGVIAPPADLVRPPFEQALPEMEVLVIDPATGAMLSDEIIATATAQLCRGYGMLSCQSPPWPGTVNHPENSGVPEYYGTQYAGEVISSTVTVAEGWTDTLPSG